VSSTHRADSIGRNAAFSLASEMSTAAFTAIITLFLVRALEPLEYGVYVLALGFAGLMAWPADFGISMSSARFVAERRGDARAVAAVVVKAIGLKFGFTSLMALLLIVLAGPIAAIYDQPELATPLRVAAISLFAQSFFFLFASCFVALGKTQRQFLLYLSEAAIEATATISLVLLVGGATAAIVGRAIGYSFGLLVGAVLIFRLLGGRQSFRERRGAPHIRRLAGYASVMMIVDSGYALFASVDVILIGALLGVTAAGVYGACIKIVAFLHYPGLATANAVAPRLARHPDHPPDAASFARSLRFLVRLHAPVAVAIAVWSEPIVNLLLGPQFAQSGAVLRALAPLIFIQGFGPLVSIAVNYLGEARRRVPIVLGCVLLNIGLLVLLVEAYGVVGAAVSVDISYALYVGAHLWICTRMVNLPLRPLLRTVARVTAAAIAMGCVLAAFGTSDLSLGDWILGPLCGAAAFAAVLIATREIRLSELREMPRTIVRGVR
jgi:O-antigen/teichoic acid export membrane protein